MNVRLSGSYLAFSVSLLFHYHFCFLFHLIIYHYYYFCILTYDSPPLACGGRVGRLCWVGQGPVLLAAGGHPTTLDNGRARAYCVCSRCGCGLFGFFSLAYHFSFLSPSLLDGWMTLDFTSISAEFHLCQDARWVMDDCVQ